MKQLKYLWLDIKSRKVVFTIFLFMVIFTIGLFAYSIDTLSEVDEDLTKVKALKSTSAYIVKDSTTDYEVQRIMSDNSSLVKLSQFFNKLETLDIIYYTEFGYEIGITPKGNILKQRSVTKRLFDVFEIKTSEGRLFLDDEYTMHNAICPIVIGYELAEDYELNNIYDFENGGTGKTFKGKVIGILRKNTSIYELNNMYMPVSLDNSYLIPLSNKYTSDNMSLADYDMAITHLVIMDKGNTIDYIQQFYNGLNLFRTKFISADDKIQEIADSQQNQMLILMIIIFILLLLTLVCIWLGFNKMIKQQMNEYGIHLLSGATLGNLLIRFITFVYTTIIIAFLIVCIIIPDKSVIFPTFLFGFFVGIIVLIYPFIKIKKLSIIEIMKTEK